MSDSISLTPSQLEAALLAAIPVRGRVLVKGAPGIGKTHVEETVAEKLGANNVIMHPSVDDPTDYKGYPFIVNGEARHIPFGQLKELDDATSLTICFIDDLGQGTTMVQAAVMQMLDRYRKNPHVAFVAATNERTHRAGVTGLLEPVKSRFDSIVALRVDFASWKLWAENHGIDYRILGYLEQQPEALHKFEATADIVNQPCPRTWAAANKVLNLALDEDVRFAMLCGAVGAAAATSFKGWLKIAEDAPTREEVLADPKNARIPSEVSAVYAIGSALALGAKKEEFAAVSLYAERLYDAQHGEICGFFLRDIFRKVPEVQKTAAWARLASVPLGKIIIEASRFNQQNGVTE